MWDTEVRRIVDLEERAGELVGLVGSYKSVGQIVVESKDEVKWLESAAGRFRRHKALTQSIRDLHNGLSRLLAQKNERGDFRETTVEVESLYDTLLVQCDRVTGKRHI